MHNTIVYRCYKKCPIGKKCFILKVKTPIVEPIVVLQKCLAKHGDDISITIGGKEPP